MWRNRSRSLMSPIVLLYLCSIILFYKRFYAVVIVVGMSTINGPIIYFAVPGAY